MEGEEEGDEIDSQDQDLDVVVDATAEHLFSCVVEWNSSYLISAL